MKNGTIGNQSLKRLALAASLVVASGCGGGSSSGASSSDTVGELTRGLNDHRESVGCPRLAWDDQLAQVAKSHSDDMFQRKYVSHVNPDGAGIADRLRAAGYSSGGENIAAGYGTASPVLQGWLASPSHRANLENCAWAFKGVGRRTLGGIWTHILAR